jgi:tetratricopeptide (TPR) repeat protein
VSVTSLKAPPEAKKAYDKGLDSLHKGKTAEAQKSFEKAVAIYPRYANVWLDLGKIRMQSKATEPAREAFQKAVDADDKLVEAHVELAAIAAQQNQWPEAAKELDMALQLDPVDFPRAWFMDAVANFNLKNFDSAEKSAREALKLDPKRYNPDADRLLGLILASKQDFSGAIAELNAYITLVPPDSPNVAQVKAQLAEIQKMAGAAKP